ncbi:MAG: hypothetical protein LBJ63_04895 [Prevotellaceae bacterium]|jgi:hypothetical protein|nr:hypothetical protein [Prevotellaceae bacterium]
MATKKVLGLTGLQTFYTKIKTLVAGYVPTTRKVNNKALSADITLSASDVGAAAASHTHNYAGSSSAGGAANSVASSLTVKLNSGTTEGTNMFTFNGSAAKSINVTPAAIGAATSADIAAAVAALNAVKITIVSSLPAVGSAQANTIYFVPSSGGSGDSYDEYMLVSGAFEKIGNTSVDLSGYLQDSDLVEITDDEIDALT